MRLLFLAAILTAAFIAYQLLMKKPDEVATPANQPVDPTQKAREVLQEVQQKIEEVKNTAPEDRPAKVLEIIKDSSLTPESIKEIMNQVPVTTAQKAPLEVIVPESFAAAPSAVMAMPVQMKNQVLRTTPMQPVTPEQQPKPVVYGISPNSFQAPAIVKSSLGREIHLI